MICASGGCDLAFSCGGVSIKGSHDINQDCYTCMSSEWGVAAVVSDGLGSSKWSEIGARAACEVIAEANALCGGDVDDTGSFLKAAHEQWTEKVSDYELKECYATCLFCVINENDMLAAQLGDGFIGIVCEDDTYVLLDDKNEHFENETDSLCEVFQPELWQSLRISAASLKAVVISTDGMSVGDGSKDEIASFCRDFYEGYRYAPIDDVEANIRGWLSDWHGGDDKTIAFIMRDEESYRNG